MIDFNWPDKKVLLTGASGLLGKSLVEELEAKDPLQLILPGHEHYDLSDQLQTQDLFATHKPDIVIHAAAKCGGINANIADPYSFFYENAIMGLNVIEESRRAGVKKLVLVGTVCSYPDFGLRSEKMSFHVDHMHLGKPEKTVEAYGLSKRLVGDLGMILGAKNDPVVLCPILANLYGPNDHFDSEDCHVIPALICKISEAKETNKETVNIIGTGNAVREFLYVQDAARMIVHAVESIHESLTFNFGSNEIISIMLLAHVLKEIIGYKGTLSFSNEGPEGINYRCLDSSEAENRGLTAKVKLSEGLKKTVDFYINSRKTAQYHEV